MKPIHEIRAVKQSREADWLSRPGVMGVDIGRKIVGGQKTDELSIRVYVLEKKDVPAKEKIPETINEVRTDVIQRRLVLHPVKMAVPELVPQVDANTYDPLRGGISIGPCRVIGGFVFVGTLGAIVRDNASGNPMLLSNFHVMSVDTGWSVGDTMAQPGRPDGGSCPGGVVGALQRAVLGGQVDCAVASITARGHRCEIVEIGDVAGTATPTEGMHVRKRGRTTGLTHGRVDTVDLTVAIDYEDGLGVVTLTNQIGIEVDTSQSTQFGNNGDSGSVVVDDSRNIVGLYFAGTEDGTFGVANPIQAVLNALNVSICVPRPKLIKAEIKDFKDGFKEKIEKPEFKERKHEKIEKPELKDRKLEKIEKPERKEFFDKEPFEGKFIREDGPVGPIGPEPGPFAAGASLDDRVARLEATVTQLSHFINPELRPDLTQGALTGEADLGAADAAATSRQLAKQAADAKQAKDAKDVEKLSER